MLLIPNGFFSDGNSLQGCLEKEECTTCETIRTKENTNLNDFYELNCFPCRNIDTVAFSYNKQLFRNNFAFNWINELSKELKIKKIKVLWRKFVFKNTYF